MNIRCGFGIHKWTEEFQELFFNGVFTLRRCARCVLTQYKDTKGKWHSTREVGHPLPPEVKHD